MTLSGGGQHQLRADEIEQISRMTGPTIREGMQKDLNAQTETIRAIVTHHENSVRTVIHDHEKTDLAQFEKQSLRIQAVEAKVEDVGGDVKKVVTVSNMLLAIIMMGSPFLVELFRHYMKW